MGELKDKLERNTGNSTNKDRFEIKEERGREKRTKESFRKLPQSIDKGIFS